MTNGFERAVAIVLEREGVLSNESWDDGGETKWGIARKAHPEITDEQWARFTKDDAIRVYRVQYWNRNRCGDMPFALGLFLFDGAVNHGVDGVKMFQRACRVAEDGVIGPRTLAAVRRQSVKELLSTYLAYRVCFIYVPHSDWSIARVGWMRRLFLNCLDLTVEEA